MQMGLTLAERAGTVPPLSPFRDTLKVFQVDLNQLTGEGPPSAHPSLRQRQDLMAGLLSWWAACRYSAR